MMPSRWKRAAIVLLALGGSAGSCARAIHLDAAPTGVIVITLDTTRADRLSPYGFMDASMPALDRLAREGVVFDHAGSVAPLTLPAHCSLFTGLFPFRHGVRDNAGAPLSADRITLAEILQQRGFRTAAFVGSTVLDHDRGLAQGFSTYGDVSAAGPQSPATRQRRADSVMADASRWLEEAGESPFFLWTHLYDAHRPYDPPEPFRSHFLDPYIGEIAFADSQIAQLLETLDRRGLTDRTIVVLAGDHGESLGDHGERDHGLFLYESVLHVPLIVRTRGLSPQRIGAVVRLTDVMPTILELLGLNSPLVDGFSLTGVMRGGERPLELEGFAESVYPMRFGWSSFRSLRDGRFKLIDGARPELYDLERDPFEQRNLYDERRALADAMTRRVTGLTADDKLSAAGAPQLPLVPADLIERLAALGYAAK